MTDSIFFRSWAVVNPHQAGLAYVNFAITTALKTPSSASLFSPWARRTRKAWNVCAHEAMTFVTCWLTERWSEIVTPRILIVCTRAISGRDGIRETWLFLLWRVMIISTDFTIKFQIVGTSPILNICKLSCPWISICWRCNEVTVICIFE